MKIQREFHGDKDDYILAQKFTKKIKHEAPDLVHSVVLFGSSARSTNREKIYSRDIDVLVIVNDNIQILNREVVAAFRIILQNTASSLSKRFHINNIRLTEFMEFVRNGDPIAVNMLRDGIPLMEDGFFEPLKRLLEKGKIKPSEENVWVYAMKAPQTIQSAKWHILQGTIDLYWAVLNAGHAALLATGNVPYHPKHLAQLMRTEIIKKGHMPTKHLKIIHKYHQLQEDILKRKIRHISGAEFDEYAKEVGTFINDMKLFIQNHHPHMNSR